MRGFRKSKGTSFTPFRSAAEEVAMMHGNGARDRDDLPPGRIMRVAGAELPYVVVLTASVSDAAQHAFATMREAEIFMKHNTPDVTAGMLSPLYDRPAGG
jgi:hypothetical protein